MEEKALLGAAQGGLSSPEYVELCRWLASRLKPLCELEESVTSGPGEPHSQPTVTPDAQSCLTYNLFFLSSLSPLEDMDSLLVEMSGLLKELHCPHEEVVSGILKGGVRNTKDHLKLVCVCLSLFPAIMPQAVRDLM